MSYDCHSDRSPVLGQGPERQGAELPLLLRSTVFGISVHAIVFAKSKPRRAKPQKNSSSPLLPCMQKDPKVTAFYETSKNSAAISNCRVFMHLKPTPILSGDILPFGVAALLVLELKTS